MEHLIIMLLLNLLVIITLGIIYLKDLLSAIILLGIYSLVAAAIFLVMDAVDVAFTEAAVGAGISTILLLGTLSFTQKEQKPVYSDKTPSRKKHNRYAFITVCLTGALLIYGTFDMPKYGDATATANQSVELAQHYIQKSGDEIGVPNVVTSVLASYRGYDTLGETAVVFTAAIAVLSLLGLRRRRRKGEPEWDKSQQKLQQEVDTK